MSGKPYAWVDEFLPSRRHTRRYTQHDPLLYPRFSDTDVPVPAEDTPCLKDADYWFSDGKGDATFAKRVCSLCWMKPECQAYGLEHPEEHGIWGGLSQSERKTHKARRTR